MWLPGALTASVVLRHKHVTSLGCLATVVVCARFGLRGCGVYVVRCCALLLLALALALAFVLVLVLFAFSLVCIASACCSNRWCALPYYYAFHCTELLVRAVIIHAPLCCGVVFCCMLYNNVLRCAVLRCAVLRCAVLRCAVLRCAALQLAQLRCVELCFGELRCTE